MLEIVVSVLCLAPPPAGALHPVTGTVRDEAGRPVAVARVERVGGPEAAETGADGRFQLNLPAGKATLRARRDGREVESTLEVGPHTAELELVLPATVRRQETVVVEAVRATEGMPVPATDLARADLERLDRGQELPFLLKETPSVTQYADNGSEGGYGYLYLRGIPQTRLNLTLDGVPLTDAEDNAFYSVNLGGLTGVLESAQVQRGAGTSSFGAAPFAGSVSLASLQPRDDASARAAGSLGSLGSGKAALEAHSGGFGPGLAAFGRVFYQESDGYRDHSGVRQRSGAIGLTRQTPDSFLKILALGGREQQQLAFLAVEDAVLRERPRENPLSSAERDDFGQHVLSAQLSRTLGERTRLAVLAYTNAASGWYRLYADPERSILQEYQLDWRAIGGIATVAHRRGSLELTAGAQAQGFSSTHARDTVDVGRDYSNEGDKDEASAFAKAGLVKGRLFAWTDLQVRHARFRYAGDRDLGEVSWTFFNPRVGGRFSLRPSLSFYASLGRIQREPARSDLFAGQDNPTLDYDLEAVKPERVLDVETGADWQGERLSLQANAFFMEFRDEIAQTGELSEIGLPLRRNVAESYRRGLELEAAFRVTEGLRLRSSLSFVHARFSSWTQFLDVYDEDGAYLSTEAKTFADVAPLLTPSFTGSLGADYTHGPVTVSASGRYVSPAHLDNTGTLSARTPGFFDADATLRGRRRFGKVEVALRLDLLNVFDHRERWPAGYSYPYLVRGGGGADRLAGINYFYPLAGRTVLVGLELGL